jgi:hypothetical protein
MITSLPLLSEEGEEEAELFTCSSLSLPLDFSDSDTNIMASSTAVALVDSSSFIE